MHDESFLGELYHVTFALCRRKSACLSSVCLSVTFCTLPTGLNFSAIFFHRLVAQGLAQFVLKFWNEIQMDSG